MDFKEQYESYNQKLKELKSQCAEAERQAIVYETNLNNLRQQKKQLIQECKTLAGVPMDKVSDLLEEKKKELDAIMSKLSMIDTSNSQITQEKLDAIKLIAKEFSIEADK